MIIKIFRLSKISIKPKNFNKKVKIKLTIVIKKPFSTRITARKISNSYEFFYTQVSIFI